MTKTECAVIRKKVGVLNRATFIAPTTGLGASIHEPLQAFNNTMKRAHT